MYYFILFFCIVFGIVSLFECLDFVQKYLAKTSADPFVIMHRSIRHIYQFFPYLLFAVFAYTVRMIIQKHEFQTLQYLGFGQSIWIKLASLLVINFFLLFYFCFTPLQRLALDRSQKPATAIQSVLLVPTGIWFLDKSSSGITRFIKAEGYDKTIQKLKNVHFFTIPATLQFEKWMPAPEKTLMNSTQDYFPYLSINNKINTLQKMGFSPIDYRLIQHRLWFLPLYFFGLALLAFFLAQLIQSTIYFFLVIFGATIVLFFAHEMTLSFVMAEKIAFLPMLISLLIGLYTLCGGCWYVATVRSR